VHKSNVCIYQGNLRKFVKVYYLGQKSREGRQEWTKPCVETGIHPKKTQYPSENKVDTELIFTL
jgi:hypothetical protein